MTSQKPVGAYVMIGGGAALVVGAFMPWIEAVAPLIGSVSKSGTDGGGDGWFAVAAGVGAIVLGLLAMTGSRPAAPIGIIVGGLAAILMVVEIGDIHDRIEAVKGGPFSADYGSGLILCLVGAIGVFGGSLFALKWASPVRELSEKYPEDMPAY